MEQSLDLQLDALLKEGIPQKNIYMDKVSSTKEVRKSLSKLLKYVRYGDTIVVWKLDWLARSLIHLTNLMTKLKGKNVRFRSITEPFIDTTEKSSHSEFIVNIFVALAQLDRDIIIERQRRVWNRPDEGESFGCPKGIE